MSKQRIVQFENKVEDERKIRVDRRKERVVRSYVRVTTFELEHQLFEQEQEELDLELHIISNINQEIAHNPVFYPALVAEFGYNAVVLGTDITFRAFAAQHQGAWELEQQEARRLADKYAGADDKLNPDNDPDLTPPSTPHPSAGVMPAIWESLLNNESTSGSLHEEREGLSDQSAPNFVA